MGKTGHGNYWRGWDGAEDYKLLEWFVKRIFIWRSIMDDSV